MENNQNSENQTSEKAGKQWIVIAALVIAAYVVSQIFGIAAATGIIILAIGPLFWWHRIKVLFQWRFQQDSEEPGNLKKEIAFAISSWLTPVAIGVVLISFWADLWQDWRFWVGIVLFYLVGFSRYAWDTTKSPERTYKWLAIIILVSTIFGTRGINFGDKSPTPVQQVAASTPKPIAVLDAPRGNPEDPEGWSETVYREWPNEYDRVNSHGYDVWMEVLDGAGRRIIPVERVKDAEDVHIPASSCYVRYKTCADQPGDQVIKIYRN